MSNKIITQEEVDAAVNALFKTVQGFIEGDEATYFPTLDAHMLIGSYRDAADLMCLADYIQVGSFAEAAEVANRLDTMVREMIPDEAMEVLERVPGMKWRRVKERE